MEVVWTNTANEALMAVLKYTIEEFSERRARILARKIFKTANLFSSFPKMYEVDRNLDGNGKEYRSAIVIDLIKLIYRIQEDNIYIEYVWDVRLPAYYVLKQINKQ